MAQAAAHNGTSWDLEADVLVIGSGAAGLPAAIKAIEGGASVIVVEANYDVGGHAILSGGHMALGGGTSLQRKYGIEDSPDVVFSDLTDWSIVQPNGTPDFRYNDRAVMHYARGYYYAAKRQQLLGAVAERTKRAAPAESPVLVAAAEDPTPLTPASDAYMRTEKILW